MRYLLQLQKGSKRMVAVTGGAWLEMSYAFVHYWWLGEEYCRDVYKATTETCAHAGRELSAKPWALADYDPRAHFQHTPRFQALLRLLRAEMRKIKS